MDPSHWSVADNLGTTNDNDTSVFDYQNGYAGHVTYNNNLNMLEHNATHEIDELQRRSRERMVYDTRAGNVTPLLPKWQTEKEGIAEMRYKAAMDSYNTYNAQPMQLQGNATYLPRSNYGSDYKPMDRYQVPVDRYQGAIMQAVKGVLYDLRHWKQLPPNQDAEPNKFVRAAGVVLLRDSRLYYVLTIIFSIIILMVIMRIIAARRS